MTIPKCNFIVLALTLFGYYHTINAQVDFGGGY